MLFEPTPTSYQEVPYPNDPYRSSHPDQLATVAILAGLAPPPVRCCRVLELGCARGGNLIPMAVAIPDAQFVGFDSSSHQVREACELIERVGLQNIRVEARDILDLDAAIGTFDFIICHGTYSWVEKDVQDRILEISASCLAPDGLVYVSYNTYPGWHFRGLVRELMCYHVRRFEEPEVRAREARGVLRFITTSAQSIEPVYSGLLRQELDYITARNDSYLLHDHLESVNEPVYFHEFVERAGRQGLQYVAEVQNTSIPSESLPPGIADGLRRLARDDVEYEQFLDFVINRRFRQSVLCHAGTERQGGMRAGDLHRLHVAARGSGNPDQAAPPDEPVLKAALDQLHKLWPLAVSFESLLHRVEITLRESTDWPSLANEAIAETLEAGLVCCFGQKRVELGTLPPAFVVEISDRPVASPLSRVQAQLGDTVTNLRHEAGKLNDFGREVLCLLDGRHDRRALLEKLVQGVRAGRFTLRRAEANASGHPSERARTLEDDVEPSLDDCLKKLARFALLIA
jgi:SAM-dependent methyltransferase